MNTFFSISMPIHNAEMYVGEAIASVMLQDYDNFELILVDDSSTDHSLSICEEWKAKYPDRITIVKNAIRGSLYARRECIHRSRGEYIYIMDSDDYLTDRSSLSLWDNTIQTKQCDLLIFNDTKMSNSLFLNTPFETGDVIEGKDLVTLYDAIVTGRQLNRLWDKVFSRKLVDNEDDIYRDHSYLSHGTDFYQSIAIISNARRVCYLNKGLYFYRQTPGSITHTYNSNMFKSALELIQRREAISKTWGEKPENLEIKLKTMALIDLCTVINKLSRARIPVNEKVCIMSKIGNNRVFIDNYEAKSFLPNRKKWVVTMIRLTTICSNFVRRG